MHLENGYFRETARTLCGERVHYTQARQRVEDVDCAGCKLAWWQELAANIDRFW